MVRLETAEPPEELSPAAVETERVFFYSRPGTNEWFSQTPVHGHTHATGETRPNTAPSLQIHSLCERLKEGTGIKFSQKFLSTPVDLSPTGTRIDNHKQRSRSVTSLSPSLFFFHLPVISLPASLSHHPPLSHLVAVVLGPADGVLLGVDPVQLLVQGVVVDGAHVAQAVDGQDDVRALLLVHHHAVDGRLLAEQQEGGGGWRWGRGRGGREGRVG